MHTHLLTNVMRWPMEVFDQTPIGRILNRFSKEIEVVDVTLPQNLRSWLLQFFSVTSRFSAFMKLRFPLRLPFHLVSSFIEINNLCHRWRGRAVPFLCAISSSLCFTARDTNWLWWSASLPWNQRDALSIVMGRFIAMFIGKLSHLWTKNSQQKFFIKSFDCAALNWRFFHSCFFPSSFGNGHICRIFSRCTIHRVVNILAGNNRRRQRNAFHPA